MLRMLVKLLTGFLMKSIVIKVNV